MTLSTSAVAVCCSSASLSSRLSTAFFFFRAAMEAPVWRVAVAGLRRDSFAPRRLVFWRLVRLTATSSPELQAGRRRSADRLAGLYRTDGLPLVGARCGLAPERPWRCPLGGYSTPSGGKGGWSLPRRLLAGVTRL